MTSFLTTILKGQIITLCEDNKAIGVIEEGKPVLEDLGGIFNKEKVIDD